MADSTASVSRVAELGGRQATVLEHERLRVMIDDLGGMTPEFSGSKNGEWINAHWLSWFRSNTGKPYNDAEHGSFWKANLLYHVSGAFPCLPNFGPGHIIDGVNMPAHGWTANQEWRYVTHDLDEASGAVWVLSVMESPDKSMPLSFSKIDAVVPGQAVHYSSIHVRNRGDHDIEISAGFHNTVGAPFLAPGCRISGAASSWMTPPPGSEFDTTTRLALGAEFSSLAKAPLLRGGKADLSVVSPPNGFTDFATGAIPPSAELGWLGIVNPSIKMAYISFFVGPAAASIDDIIFYFNNLWFQYGGRPFTPWAPYEGGSDLTYCLGAENAVSAFANGLEYSRNQHKLLGNPTTVTVPAMSQKTLRYGTLFAAYEGSSLDEGIVSVQGEDSMLVTKGKEKAAFAADPRFAVLRTLENRHV
jgi:hypothetical protein